MLRALVWGGCLLAGFGSGLLLAAQGEPARSTGDPPPLAAARLERAFGPTCTAEIAPPAIALRAPLDGHRERYLRARCLAAAGRLPEAIAALREGLAEDPPDPSLWHWSLLQALVLGGDHDGALPVLEALLVSRPLPLTRDRLRSLLAELVLEPGEAPPERRRAYLLTYLEHAAPDASDYDLIERLWTLSETPGGSSTDAGSTDAGSSTDGAGGSTGAAAVAPSTLRDSLALLMWRNPKDGGAAARWAEWYRGLGGAPPVAITGADYYARAARLFELGLRPALAKELEQADLPPMDERYAKALGRLYFRALINANQLSHAAVQVNTTSVMRRFAFDRRQQLIWAIRIQLRRRVIGAAMKYTEELEQLAPDDEELASIYLELLKYNQGRRDTVSVLHWLERIATRHGDSAAASDAYWQVVWDAIEREAYEEAGTLLAQAIRSSEPFHPVDQARLMYWQGRVQMRTGDQAAGEATWRAMIDRWPYGYYSAMAEWVLAGEKLVMTPGAQAELPSAGPAPVIAALWEVKPFPHALFLFAVDEPDLAAQLLRDALSQRMSAEAVEEAGALFAYLGRDYLQLRLVANHHLGTLRTLRLDRSPLWQRAFPRPHWDVVSGLATEHQLDPYFILAIMREESRFFTSANSTAGARGLMQLMPSTARMVAQRNGLVYDEALLHTPEFNIPLGALYLKRVLARFDSNPFYAAAAYNAGPGNAQRWLRRHGKLPLDEFVERIPFGETQRYVKRVFLSYRVYSKLYR